MSAYERLRFVVGTALSAALCVAATNAAAQNAACGKPPEYDARQESYEKMRGDLNGRAQVLSRFLGSADLSGKIEAERRDLYKSSPATEAARADAYLAYLFCVIIMDDRSLGSAEKIKALQDFRRPLGPVTSLPPNLPGLPGPTSAAYTRVNLSSLGQFTYVVANTGWADDMKDVEISLWAVVGGRAVKLDERRIAFLAKNDHSSVDNVRRPFDVGRLIVCMSYGYQGGRFNVMEFYSNEDISATERQVGLMKKFRPTIAKAVEGNDLCRAMPASVAGQI